MARARAINAITTFELASVAVSVFRPSHSLSLCLCVCEFMGSSCTFSTDFYRRFSDSNGNTVGIFILKVTQSTRYTPRV